MMITNSTSMRSTHRANASAAVLADTTSKEEVAVGDVDDSEEDEHESREVEELNLAMKELVGPNIVIINAEECHPAATIAAGIQQVDVSRRDQDRRIRATEC